MASRSEIRKSLGITGGKPTMPFDKKGSVQGDIATRPVGADPPPLAT